MIKKLVVLFILTLVAIGIIDYSGAYDLPYTQTNILYSYLTILALYILYIIFYKFFKAIVSLFMLAIILFIIYYVYHFVTGNSLDFIPF
ncbi:hypothetical protein [Phocicoccus pinnipedialis]|uniref:Uncharacterized protein n=1 Tax=Phocicoccus pinnipedialis TaxID=110845 RepID=A0A6V7RDY8_9BACL|nr:hypothetical protein [Jeotgalicoccus pinnipedialis]MBP1939526.1 hypothetical protein [Jeotgalicoccus pinnipedialis]CAD2075023.1 hypothetical protein JEOPIN946_00913 [Jeotgalicoccus pinnipedialis]